MKLSKINVLGEYIAVMKYMSDVPDGIEAEQVVSTSNEGIVVGVGPEAEGFLEFGDLVIFKPNRYMVLTPASGCYENKRICIMKKIDIVVRKKDKVQFEIEEDEKE